MNLVDPTGHVSEPVSYNYDYDYVNDYIRDVNRSVIGMSNVGGVIVIGVGGGGFTPGGYGGMSVEWRLGKEKGIDELDGIDTVAAGKDRSVLNRQLVQRLGTAAVIGLSIMLHTDLSHTGAGLYEYLNIGTIKDGLDLARTANYSTGRGWLEGTAGILGAVGLTVDAASNFFFPEKGAAEKGAAKGLGKNFSEKLSAKLGSEAGFARIGRATDVNKLNHIFGQAKHNMGPLLESFGGNQAKAFNALETAAKTVVTQKGLTGVFKETVSIYGHDVTVTGNVMGKVTKLSNAYIP